VDVGRDERDAAVAIMGARVKTMARSIFKRWRMADEDNIISTVRCIWAVSLSAAVVWTADGLAAVVAAPRAFVFLQVIFEPTVA
jgi:hypothetical protein